MNYDFNKPVDRRNTNCRKFDTKSLNNIPEDATPLWIADMDFETAPCIAHALTSRALHPIYGYTHKPETYNQAIMGWLERRHNWSVESDWIVTAPNIVFALGLIASTFCNKGDSILVQRPIYHPFEESVTSNGRQIINNQLILKDNRYEIDFADFEAKVSDPNTKIFFLCNPHNPVGRVWTPDELRRMGELCIQHNVLIVSDEIHHDFVFKGFHYTPMATVSEAISNHLITCLSPGKTFNVAGIAAANIIIKDAILRKTFNTALAPLSLHNLSPFAIDLVVSGYNEGDEWVDGLVSYIEENKVLLENFFKEHMPSLNVIQSEGTYLLWIDCRSLGFKTQEELIDFITHKAKWWVHSGTIFDPAAVGFIRVNIATQRSNLEKALQQLKEALAIIHNN